MGVVAGRRVAYAVEFAEVEVARSLVRNHRCLQPDRNSLRLWTFFSIHLSACSICTRVCPPRIE